MLSHVHQQFLTAEDLGSLDIESLSDADGLVDPDDYLRRIVERHTKPVVTETLKPVDFNLGHFSTSLTVEPSGSQARDSPNIDHLQGKAGVDQKYAGGQ